LNSTLRPYLNFKITALEQIGKNKKLN